MRMFDMRFASAMSIAGLVAACSSSSQTTTSTAPAVPTLKIVPKNSASEAPLSAVAGDALALTVVIVGTDGTVTDLPAGAMVTWTAPATLTALASDSSAASPIPSPGATPTVAWLANPGRSDRNANLANVLFVLDPGTMQNATVDVTATVTGATPSGPVAAKIAIDPAPAGDWTRGALLFGASGANCAECHGATGHGSPGAPAASSYVIAGATYDFPAPGLNAEMGNAASDPAWNAALFAVAARSDIDNGGLTLRAPMPDWLTEANPSTRQPLTTQDFADIFSWLKTQSQ